MICMYLCIYYITYTIYYICVHTHIHTHMYLYICHIDATIEQKEFGEGKKRFGRFLPSKCHPAPRNLKMKLAAMSSWGRRGSPVFVHSLAAQDTLVAKVAVIPGSVYHLKMT